MAQAALKPIPLADRFLISTELVNNRSTFKVMRRRLPGTNAHGGGRQTFQYLSVEHFQP